MHAGTSTFYHDIHAINIHLIHVGLTHTDAKQKKSYNIKFVCFGKHNYFNLNIISCYVAIICGCFNDICTGMFEI